MSKYYIISKKWTGKGTYPSQVTFWRPDSKGYTIYLEDAGVYSEEELDGIPIGFLKGGDDYALPCEIVDNMKHQTIPEKVHYYIPNELQHIEALEKWKP